MNKQIFLAVAIIAVLTLHPNKGWAQGLAVNNTGNPPDTSAMLDVSSTSKGMLVPRMDSAQRTLIHLAASGLMVYQTDGATPGYYYNSGTAYLPAWTPLSGMPAGAATGDIQYWNGSAWINLAPGTNGQLLTINSGVPSWTTFSAYVVTEPVITTEVVNAGNTFAYSGGDISSDGGSAVTARGVCWSATPGPTISSSHTTDGTGTGYFSSSISGLASGATYYMRAYATNSIGTVYGTQYTFTTLVIGQTYQGGIIAYFLQPGDPGYSSTVTHGLIAAPSDQSTGIQWGCNTITSGASGTAIGTGAANTALIVSVCGTGNAAYICHTLSLGGYTDWYLPSYNELLEIEVNATAIGGFSGGLSFYWSSSEYTSIYAFSMYPSAAAGVLSGAYSYFNVGNKSTPYYVRAIRSF